MKGISKLALVAIASASLGALVADAVHARVTLAHQVTSPAIPSTARSKSYIDWEGARSQSFGSRVLATGGNSEAGAFLRRYTGVSVFGGMDKMQVWSDGLPPR
jgi:hypothetical protein